MTNSEVVSAFLEAYKAHDWTAMHQHLAPQTEFSDMAFDLKGDDVRTMWRWFTTPRITRNKKAVEIGAIAVTSAGGDRVEARYEVDYTLTDDGEKPRRIRYTILAAFTVRDGKIVQQKDRPRSKFWFAWQAAGFPKCLAAHSSAFNKGLRAKTGPKFDAFKREPAARAAQR